MEHKHPKILFISPHSDDLALSLGGFLGSSILYNYDCYACTIFTKSIHSPYIDCNNNVKKITAMRIAEDKAFCNNLNLTYLNAGFSETTTRGYKNIKSIFSQNNPCNDELYPAVEQYLCNIFLSENWSFIFVPVGIGNHVEHLIVNKISQKYKADNTIYYEDLPYADDYDDNYLQNIVKSINMNLHANIFTFKNSDKQLHLSFFPSQINSEERKKVSNFGQRRFIHKRNFKRLNTAPFVNCDAGEILWADPTLIHKLKGTYESP